MRSTLNRSVAGLMIAFCLSVVANAQTTAKDLPNLYKVNADLYRGGQPTEAGIRQLKAMGIRTVIDLRDDDGRAEREEGWVRAAGMRFVNIPLNNLLGPKDAKVEAVLAQIERKENEPVFIHCKRGADRTGTAIAVYRISHDGWTGKQASEEARRFGFGWWQVFMKDYIDDYYRDRAGSK